MNDRANPGIAFLKHATFRFVVFVVVCFFPSVLCAQFDFNESPINYQDSEANDRIADLARQLESGEIELSWNDSNGWLDDLLKRLKVPAASQALVFSKTSLQNSRIHPANPRAIYFNDDTYIGYIPGAKNIELSAVDPELGAVFYTVKQVKVERPPIKRDQHECMTCHGTANTKNVPGFLIRSVFPLASGHPKYSLGTTTSDHTTPFADRFGGWYVTGQHGDMRHRGNGLLKSSDDESLDQDPGANRTGLPTSIKAERYVSGTSDLVALMVLEHQTQMHNLITAANYEARRSADYDKRMNKLFDRPIDHVSDTTKRRIKSAGDRLVKYMLFADEAKLTSKISGNEEFAEQFEEVGPKGSRGRSLRQFDLETRMFRYPCSFLIYSESFANLPKPMLDYVDAQLLRILSNHDENNDFPHLSDDDRLAIREILTTTIPRLGKRLSQLGSEGK